MNAASSSSASPAACFAADYAAARARFVAACGRAGAALVSHRHPLAGPDGEPLFLDEARLGAPDARRVLFLLSGTHGIEGFCGSGIQTHLLEGGLAGRIPAGVALVLVHAVNPWGFAWLRRVNEDGVDLNRNFLDHAAPHPENPDYDLLYEVMHPAELDEAAVAASLEAVKRFTEERGSEALYRAVSGGQYAHPEGMQYGGRAPTWSNRRLRAVWARHAAAAELAVNVDLHSGLGPRGVGLLLQTAPEASDDARLAAAWWEDVIRSEPGAGGDAALVTGLVGPAFREAHPHAAAVHAVLEYGTVEPTRVVLAMQADHWMHRFGARDSERGRAIVQAMREAFFVDEEDWKEKVCARAVEVLERTFRGMATFEGRPGGSSAELRVRGATPDDRDVLVEFAVAMARETEEKPLDAETVRRGVEALLADPTKGRAFVVEAGGEVVATLALTLEWSDWRDGYFWWIQSVYVHAAHRRRGHYRRLHDHVVAEASRDPEVCGLRLYVERENAAARATYASLGMEETPYRVYELATPT